jgi:hypothetical protein
MLPYSAHTVGVERLYQVCHEITPSTVSARCGVCYIPSCGGLGERQQGSKEAWRKAGTCAWLVSSVLVAWRQEEWEMVLVVVYVTVLLGMAIGLLGGTILVYLRLAYMQPSRVEEIRHLRQAGLAVASAKE